MADRTWTLRSGGGKFGGSLAVDGESLYPGEKITVVEESRLLDAEAERANVSKILANALEVGDEALARAERLEAELREAREALADIVKLGTTYQRHLHRQFPGQPPPDPRYHDEPVYSPEAVRARDVLEKGDTGGG